MTNTPSGCKIISTTAETPDAEYAEQFAEPLRFLMDEHERLSYRSFAGLARPFSVDCKLGSYTMIDADTSFSMCDECPADEGVEYRLHMAKEGGRDPQFEYCWCEKHPSRFLFSGCCEDAVNTKPKSIKKGKRKTGMAYRRKMKQKHNKDLAWVIHNCGYNPAAGRITWDWVDGVWQPIGKYIKYPKNSNAQQYWKRHSNKIVRKKKEIFRGNAYRKCFDYWWTLY